MTKQLLPTPPPPRIAILASHGTINAKKNRVVCKKGECYGLANNLAYKKGLCFLTFILLMTLKVIDNFADTESDEAQRFATWFENLDFLDHSRNYMKPRGCAEELFVQSIYKSFEENVILMVRRRCLPCFKKEVGGRSKLYVGFFYPTQ